MGGSNEDTISGLRIHVKDDDIHIHDDSKSIKFELDLEQFKIEVKDAFDALKKKDGFTEITGTGCCLCLIKRNKKFTIVLLDKTSIKQKIQDYLKGC